MTPSPPKDRLPSSPRRVVYISSAAVVRAVVALVRRSCRLDSDELPTLDLRDDAARRRRLRPRPGRGDKVLVREVRDGLQRGDDVGALGLRARLLHGLEQHATLGPRERGVE